MVSGPGVRFSGDSTNRIKKYNLEGVKMTEKKKPEPTLTVPPRPPNPITLEERMRNARTNFEKAFKEFHKLLGDKVLVENKSEAARRVEKHTVDEVVKACVNLDQLNVGEGVMALAVVALREHLKVRDRINELEYQLELSKREVKNLKKELGIEK